MTLTTITTLTTLTPNDNTQQSNWIFRYSLFVFHLKAWLLLLDFLAYGFSCVLFLELY